MNVNFSGYRLAINHLLCFFVVEKTGSKKMDDKDD